MIRVYVCATLWLAACPAYAMVGGAPQADDVAAKAVVTVVGARGNFCSGALIAPDLVLTAAHCIGGGAAAEFKLVTYDAARTPSLLDIKRVTVYPQFSLQAILNHRASADVALLQLSQPLGLTPAAIGIPLAPLKAGKAFRVIGIGVTKRGDGRTGGLTRAASLIATGQPGTLQIRLVDPATDNQAEGLGACTGDSGAPLFEDQSGRSVIVGVVSWSTGAGNAAGCGGLTGATPLTLYRDWIAQTARLWGAKVN